MSLIKLLAAALTPPNVEVAIGFVIPATVDATAEGAAEAAVDLNVSLSSVIYGDV